MDGLGIAAGDPRHYLPEDGVVVANHDLNLGILAGCICLKLQPQDVPVAQQKPNIGMAHFFEDALGVEASVGRQLPGVLESEASPVEAIPDRGYEQLLLGAEELEEVRLRHSGASCDRRRGGAGIAGPGELDRGGGNDLVAAFFGGKAGVHGHNLVSTKSVVKSRAY